MPTASIRKRVYGLIRTTFSPGTSLDASALGTSDAIDQEHGNSSETSSASILPSTSNSFISQCILTGRNGPKNETEIYAGKTGLDLPVLMLEELSERVRASYTGPDGGLTEVCGVRRQPIVHMANLDDELSLSFDGESLDEWTDSMSSSRENDHLTSDLAKSKLQQSTSGLIGSCSSLMGPCPTPPGFETPRSDTDRYDWTSFNEERCFGISVSLYERNPITGQNAGNPIADVFGVVARDNNVIMALADGVNWGEGSRLAARCAVRGAIDHLNYHVFADQCKTTTEIFHTLLGAFHSAHALILQEGGLLTTLCVAVAVQLKHSDTWVLCCCNVGDSLCFVYNPIAGVREVTIASHDILQMRDMRDAGGALGPVDGTNPQLHNLTCSMTFVEPDDVIFITSDGISDNFDPVVGKFCVIKKTECDNKENNGIVKSVQISTTAANNENGNDWEFSRTRTCNATLPCVDAEQRHELMLLRMGDIVSNGILPPSARSRSSPKHRIPAGGVIVSTSKLCHNLIQFAKQLSMAKRRTLEDPELYKNEKHLTKHEQRNRRRMVRAKLSEMPGKLDHASVVAFKVGLWPTDSERSSQASISLENGVLDNSEGNEKTPVTENGICFPQTLVSSTNFPLSTSEVALTPSGDDDQDLVFTSESVVNNDITENIRKVSGRLTMETVEEIDLNVEFSVKNDYYAETSGTILSRQQEKESVQLIINFDNPIAELVSERLVKSNPPTSRNQLMQNLARARSPYEETPIALRNNNAESRKLRKKHPRGSTGRHTLSVDVQWLKRLVTSKNSNNGSTSNNSNNIQGNGNDEKNCANPLSRHSLIQDDGTTDPVPVLQPQSTPQQTISSLRQRIRSLMGSARNIRQPSGVTCAPAQNLPSAGNYPKQILSANSSPKKRPQAY